MGWLKLSFGKGGTAVAERETAESAPEAPSGPPIIVLVNDAAGRAAFKEYVFYDVEAATDWVSYWFPHQTEDGMIAFWAMPEEPESDAAEPLVIIRDTARQGVVYMFSFANLAAAEGFIGEEADHGTDPESMVLYWAVPVKREFDHLGKIRLTPSTPPSGLGDEPRFRSEVDRRVERQDPPSHKTASEDRSGALEEAANARTGVAQPMGPAEETFELTSWVHRSRKRDSDQLALDSESSESLIEGDEPALFIEPVIREITEDFEKLLKAADESVDNADLEADDARSVNAGLAPAIEAVAQPTAAEGLTENATLAEPMQVEDVASNEAFGEPFEDEVVTMELATVAEPAQADRVTADTETLAGPVEADALNDPSETPAERSDDEVGAADEPGLPDYDLPEHEVGPPSVNGNGHVSEVTSALWERADEIAGKVPSNVHENGVSTEQVKYATREVIAWDATEKIDGTADTPENGTSSKETKKRIKEVLVNVNVNVNLNDPTDSETTTQVSIVSRALKIKRWEVREEPFEGFNSPPGRF
jgi:hypothetical protein